MPSVNDSNLAATCLSEHNWLCTKTLDRQGDEMRSAYRAIGVGGCLLASLCVGAQAVGGTRKIVLPNPQLIHCHSATCSQLWREGSVEGEAVYPAQLLTDLVNGEIGAHRRLRQICVNNGNPSGIQRVLRKVATGIS